MDASDGAKLMHWVGKNLCSNLFSVLANELDPNESELDSQKFNFELNLREALCELFCSLQKCEDFEQDHFWNFLDLFEKFEYFCTRNMEYYHENPCQYLFFQKRRSIVFQICMCVLWDALQSGLSSKELTRKDMDSISPENFNSLIPYQQYESSILDVFNNEFIAKQYSNGISREESAIMDRETLTREFHRYNRGYISVDKALDFLQCSHGFASFRESMLTFLGQFETMFLPLPLMVLVASTNKRLKTKSCQASELVDLTSVESNHSSDSELREETHVKCESPQGITIRVNRRATAKKAPKGKRVAIGKKQKSFFRNMWDVDETNALIDGIQNIGLGRWVQILDSETYGPLLRSKDNQQLKDKAKNLERNETITVIRRPTKRMTVTLI